MKIMIPRHLSLAQLRLELTGLVDDLARHGVTHVACPELGLLAFEGPSEVSLRFKRRDVVPFGKQPYLGFSDRTHLRPASERRGVSVELTRGKTVLGPGVFAQGSPDTFKAVPDITEAEAKTRYVELGKRWNLSANDVHALSRHRFDKGGFGDLFSQAADGFSLSHAERLSLLERIADAGQFLMGSDEIVSGWLHGPYPMQEGGEDRPWLVLTIQPWRRIHVMALALEAHVFLRRALHATKPMLVGPGYTRILTETPYWEPNARPIEEAHQYMEPPATPAEAFLTDERELPREIEALARAETQHIIALTNERDRKRGRR